MYRAIPEINRICAMQDRNRRYKLHKEALKKIRQTSTPRNLSTKSNLERSLSQKSLNNSQYEEAYRIQQENAKMVKAISNQEPTINRAELHEFELDHKRQVSRLLKCDYSYGYNNNYKKKTPQSKLSATPTSTKRVETYGENYEKKENCIFINGKSNDYYLKESTKPSFIQAHGELFHLDLSKVPKEDF